MMAGVPHLAKHSWNAERKKEEEGRESCPIPLTHIAQNIPHEGHTNTSTLLESSSLNINHTNNRWREGEEGGLGSFVPLSVLLCDLEPGSFPFTKRCVD